MDQITTCHPVSTLKCDKCCRELGFDSLDIYSELVEAINQRHKQCDFCFCQGPVLDKHKSLQNGGLSAPWQTWPAMLLLESLSNAVSISERINEQLQSIKISPNFTWRIESLDTVKGSEKTTSQQNENKREVTPRSLGEHQYTYVFLVLVQRLTFHYGDLGTRSCQLIVSWSQQTQQTNFG